MADAVPPGPSHPSMKDRIPLSSSETPGPWVIGLDVGGTKIAGGVVALDSGQVISRRVVPTDPHRGGNAVLAAVLSLAESLLREAVALGVEVGAVGVGVAELVNERGDVQSSHTIGWRDLPVRERLSRVAPATVQSDVRAAALAEAIYGAGRGYSLFTYVTVGTGISYCLVQDGHPYAGARGNALVLGSGPLSTTCTECGASLNPVLEEIASGPALVARYYATGGAATSGEDVIAAAAAGDSIALGVVRSAGEALGNSVGFLVNVLDPEAVIVGGGLGLAGGGYWDSFVGSAREHIWSDLTRELPVLRAALGIDAGIIGAAASTRVRAASARRPVIGCAVAVAKDGS